MIFHDLPRMTSASLGSSSDPIELDEAVAGCKTFEQAGCVDSEEINYGIVTYDTTTHRPIGTEVGTGKYYAVDSDGNGPYLERVTVLSSISLDSDDVMDERITLTGLSEVYMPLLSKDIVTSSGNVFAYAQWTNTVTSPTIADGAGGQFYPDFDSDTLIYNPSGIFSISSDSARQINIDLAGTYDALCSIQYYLTSGSTFDSDGVINLLMSNTGSLSNSASTIPTIAGITYDPGLPSQITVHGTISVADSDTMTILVQNWTGKSLDIYVTDFRLTRIGDET